MAKFSGVVCYATEQETYPGVWEPVEDLRMMKGDIIRQASNRQKDLLSNDNKVNSDISLNHRVSVIGDAFAFDNYFNIKWVQAMGRKWVVESVEVQRPRLILDLGGVFNG